MSKHTVAVVTGANKGIGLAIVRNLALQYPKSSFNKGPFLIYLASRDTTRGQSALESLHADKQLTSASALQKDGGLTTLKLASLDITQTNSIRDLRDFLAREHPDGIDIVINNAGVALDGFDAGIVKKTLECNYYGTLQACQDFLPLIRTGGRLVNIASMAGSLSKYSPELKSAFQDAGSVEEYTALMQDFQRAVEDGSYSEKGWPGSAYMVSKAGVIGLTKALAQQEKVGGGERLINACCPGYVDTDMSKHRGHKTVDQGAETPVQLALGDIDGVSGEFWQEGSVIEWDKSLVRAMLEGRRRRKESGG